MVGSGYASRQVFQVWGVGVFATPCRSLFDFLIALPTHKHFKSGEVLFYVMRPCLGIQVRTLSAKKTLCFILIKRHLCAI